MKKLPHVGDIVPYWFAPQGSRVLSVRPYDGNYPEYYRAFVRLENLNTYRGWSEVAW